jgi:hypothetical protein
MLKIQNSPNGQVFHSERKREIIAFKVEEKKQVSKKKIVYEVNKERSREWLRKF